MGYQIPGPGRVISKTFYVEYRIVISMVGPWSSRDEMKGVEKPGQLEWNGGRSRNRAVRFWPKDTEMLQHSLRCT